MCPLGGDGTVRAVAEALVGTETPLGLLPGGTGNLLARNLDLPVDSLEDALRVALTGQNKRVDVGRLTVDASGEHERPEKHIFLVMAGLGLRRRHHGRRAREPEGQGRVAGLRRLGCPEPARPQFKVRVKVADGEEFSRRTRTVVIGNCGKLLGGLVLMPEAEVADGKLDLVALSPQGIVGWAAVAARARLPEASRPPPGGPPHGHRVPRCAPTGRRRSSSTATRSARRAPSAPRSSRAPSSSGSGPSTDGGRSRPGPRGGTASRSARALRGAALRPRRPADRAARPRCASSSTL